MTKAYIAKEWQAILEEQHLASFGDIWNYEKNANIEPDWVEAPNQRRGGWSGVCRLQVEDDKGQKRTLYLKRQSKHVTRASLRHPLMGCPTFSREFRNIMRFKRRGIPTVTPIYFEAQGRDAILITEELTGYHSLEYWIAQWTRTGFPDKTTLKKIIHESAKVIGKMHHHKYKHGALKLKHVFLSLENDDIQFRFIDLEKTRYWLIRRACSVRDLVALGREANLLSLTDRWRFLKVYLEGHADRQNIKRLWRQLIKLHVRKI